MVNGKKTSVRGTAPQFCGPKFFDTGAMAVPIAGVRFGHFDDSTARRGGRGRRLARTPPRRVTRWLPPHRYRSPLRAPWSWLKHIDLIPDKGQ
jgi:hypothetical protein